MDENLITKKELLELTGISYGALYRWKRMKLLPDDWFIRRSTYTGHETYFPREKILRRVQEIQQLKDTMSLEDIARTYQPEGPTSLSIQKGETVSLGIVAAPVLNQFLSLNGGVQEFDYPTLLKLFIFGHMLTTGTVSREEALEVGETAVRAISGGTDAQTISEPVLYLVRKYGVFFCTCAGENQTVLFDPTSVILDQVSVNDLRDRLNTLLREKGAMK